MHSMRKAWISWLGCLGILIVFLFAIKVFFELLDPSWDNPYGHQMHMACIHGDTRAVFKMIMQGADVNKPVWEDTMPLMWAAGSGHRGTVKILLAAGADPNAESGHGSVIGFVGRDTPEKAKVISLLKRAGAKE